MESVEFWAEPRSHSSKTYSNLEAPKLSMLMMRWSAVGCGLVALVAVRSLTTTLVRLGGPVLAQASAGSIYMAVASIVSTRLAFSVLERETEFEREFAKLSSGILLYT